MKTKPIANLLNRSITSIARLIKRTHDKNFIGFDKYHKRGAYHWCLIEKNEDYKKKIDFVIQYVDKNKTVLDIGCGDGAYVYKMSPHCKQVIGIDADYDAIRLANKKLAQMNQKAFKCFQIPISRIDKVLGQELFDIVYSIDVIEHLPDPDELLNECARRVKPDGVVIIGTPMFISDALVSPYHVHEYGRSEIKSLLQNYFYINKDQILPIKKKDGKIYQEGFYLAECSRKIAI